MLSKVPFYHGTVRNATIAFAGLFNNIHLVTVNKDGFQEKIVKVPIQYANKEKYVVRITQDPKLERTSSITLPRMSFEITGFQYDAERKLNKIHKIQTTRGQALESREFFAQYTPVPYNISWNLYSYTKTTEDNLQIMEQILPYFGPDLNLTVKMIKNPEINQDIPLILTSVQTSDDMYDGSFEDRRMIITTYSFEMKLNIYAPLLNVIDKENHFGDGTGSGLPIIKKVIVDTNNVRYTAVVDPFEANKSDVHEIIEGFSDTPFDELITFENLQFRGNE
ncbi:MAG TPA: tail sheath stabilizer and completion protein [Allocoleopsis sp.]